jgi:hypothetical protein
MSMAHNSYSNETQFSKEKKKNFNLMKIYLTAQGSLKLE